MPRETHVRLPARGARRVAAASAVPVLAGACVAAFGASGPEGRFQAGLAVLAVAAVAFAFLPLTLRQATASLAFAAVLAGGFHLALGVGLAPSVAAAALVGGVGLAAAGLAAVGRAAGASGTAAGAVASAVIVLAATGLFVADPLAEGLPRDARRPFRQALLDVDPASALAYDGAGFERMQHPPVYRSVDMASSTYARPHAPTAAAAWGALGLLAAGAAGALGRFRARRGREP